MKIFDIKCSLYHLCKKCIKNCCLAMRFGLKSEDGTTLLCDDCINSEVCRKIGRIERPNYPLKIPIQIRTGKLWNIYKFEPKYRYIPKIEVKSRNYVEKQIECVKKNEVDTVSVSLQDILIGRSDGVEVKKRYRDKDIHNILNYKNKILLLTNIRNGLCKNILTNGRKFSKIIEVLNPDYITTPDWAFYLEHPPFLIRLNFSRIIDYIYEYMADLPCGLIGLLPPYPRFIADGLKIFVKMGFRTVSIPLMEVKGYKKRKLAKELMERCRRSGYAKRPEFLGVSIGPNKDLSFDYYTTLTWYLEWRIAENKRRRSLGLPGFSGDGGNFGNLTSDIGANKLKKWLKKAGGRSEKCYPI